MAMRRTVMLLAIAAALVGCSSTHKSAPTPTTGTAVGRMHFVPGGREDFKGARNLSGQVDVFRASAFVTYPDHTTGFDTAPIRTVKTDNGRYRISLTPGTYRLRGDPDTDTGVEIDNLHSQAFTIKANQTTPVDLVVNGF